MLPKTYGECLITQRPCRRFICNWHVFTLICTPEILAIGENENSDEEIIEKILAGETCILDISNDGENTLEAIAEIMRCSRERIRQLVVAGLNKAKMPHRKRALRGWE